MRGDISSTSFKTRPAITFLAHRNGTDQTSVSSTATLICTVAEWNVGGWFSTASGDFSPPAGFYEIGMMINLATGLNSGVIQARLSESGTVLYTGQTNAATGNPGVMLVSLIKTTGTGIYKPQLFFNGTATGTIDGNDNNTYFWAKEITR